ncbi:MAG: serine protease [Isosphaeraceae bacterium]|nr:serine protease [Isosphaeraceae bacterium]
MLNGTFLVSPTENAASVCRDDCMAISERDCPIRRLTIARRALEEGNTCDSILQTHRNDAGQPGLSLTRPEVMYVEANMLPFDFLRKGDRIGRAVVKIQRDDGATGTGFLVASDILLTNNHVLPDVETALVAVALANYETNPPDDAAGRSIAAHLDPHSLFVTNEELDFTFCAVRGLDFLGSVPLDRQQMQVNPSEIVNIIQHPRGRPKEVVLRDNWIVRADGVVLHYSCDTEPGSSGSPVFNNEWKPVALHHASVPTDSLEGRALSMEEGGRGRYINEGIRLSAIALWLETVEASTGYEREQVARLRALFGGLNAQVGFFGGLGRSARGRSAPEVVAGIYAGEADCLDIGFWDTRSTEGIPRDRLGDVARVMSEMGLDLWCFSHLDTKTAEALCLLLQAGNRSEFAWMKADESNAEGPVIIYRNAAHLSLEVVVDSSAKSGSIPGTARTGSKLDCIAVRLSRVPGETLEVRCAMIDHESDLEDLCKRVGDHDWVIFGSNRSIESFEDSQCPCVEDGRWSSAHGRPPEVGVGWWKTHGSRFSSMLTTPNLIASFEHSERIHTARDRGMPMGLRVFDPTAPVAIRLAISDPSRQADVPPNPAIPSLPTDDLDERIRKMLEPMLRKVVDELRGGVQ